MAHRRMAQTMTAELLPTWPFIIGIIVMLGAAAMLFMHCCSTHRRGWCSDCQEWCDGKAVCRCCCPAAEGRET
jgi:hypothetical protein